jgi:hypothetical protein
MANRMKIDRQFFENLRGALCEHIGDADLNRLDIIKHVRDVVTELEGRCVEQGVEGSPDEALQRLSWTLAMGFKDRGPKRGEAIGDHALRVLAELKAENARLDAIARSETSLRVELRTELTEANRLKIHFHSLFDGAANDLTAIGYELRGRIKAGEELGSGAVRVVRELFQELAGVRNKLEGVTSRLQSYVDQREDEREDDVVGQVLRIAEEYERVPNLSMQTTAIGKWLRDRGLNSTETPILVNALSTLQSFKANEDYYSKGFEKLQECLCTEFADSNEWKVGANVFDASVAVMKRLKAERELQSITVEIGAASAEDIAKFNKWWEDSAGEPLTPGRYFSHFNWDAMKLKGGKFYQAWVELRAALGMETVNDVETVSNAAIAKIKAFIVDGVAQDVNYAFRRDIEAALFGKGWRNGKWWRNGKCATLADLVKEVQTLAEERNAFAEDVKALSGCYPTALHNRVK